MSVPPESTTALHQRRFGFRPTLGVVVVLGFALRVVYVLAIGSDLVLGYDAQWYQLQAGTVSTGLGYLDPDSFYRLGLGIPTANFPPLWPLVLSGARLVGLESTTQFQLVGAAIGTVTAVLAGLLGRRLGGRAVGLSAALVVACSPLLIAADGSVMSESLYVALVTGVVLAAYAALATPTVLRFALVGILLGAAVLTRADAAFLAPIPAVALGWRVRGPSTGRRLVLTGVVLATAAAALIPWTVYSSRQMGELVVLSSNSGSVIEGANCSSTFHGELLGGWDAACLRPRDPNVSELAWAAESRSIGIDYARSQPLRVPLVAAARVLRVWGLWSPTDQARLESVETRNETWQLVGWAYDMTVLALAAGGTVVLVRRRAELTPIAALAAAIVVTAAVSNGNQRFRLAIDPVLAVLAAVAVVTAIRAIAATRHCREPITPGPRLDP